MEVLRQCPHTIAQQLVHCATAVSTAVLVHCCWQTIWTTRSKRSPTCSAQLHLPTHDLFWANLRVQLHLPPLRSLDLLISPGTLLGRPSTSLYIDWSSFLACSPRPHPLENFSHSIFHIWLVDYWCLFSVFVYMKDGNVILTAKSHTTGYSFGTCKTLHLACQAMAKSWWKLDNSMRKMLDATFSLAEHRMQQHMPM